MKIDLDMRKVGEPTQKMWELIWKMEEVLKIKYEGPEEFKDASQWINDNMVDFVFHLELFDIPYEFQCLTWFQLYDIINISNKMIKEVP